MRDSGMGDGKGSYALDCLNGLAQEALEHLAALRQRAATEGSDADLAFLIDALEGNAFPDESALLAALTGRRVDAAVVAHDLIPRAARHLGRLWEADELGFVAVTLGTARLEALLRLITANAENDARVTAEAAILVIVPPGEQHTLGASLVADQLRRAGHAVCLHIAPSAQELAQAVSDARFKLALISVGCHQALSRANGLVKTLALVSKGGLRTVIGGAICEDDEVILTATGADMVARDVSQVLAQLASSQDYAGLE